ncbi:MAG: hypothetical protein KIT84_10310 [Labilithrix sp.]|nr:hypothetical protein [Labilithrix sp.]MCW5811397.1 hypothetical protein [Labilithrix sp.]
MSELTDEDIARIVAARRRARGLRAAARRALGLARRYREEEGPRGARETACVRQALTWRSAARELLSPTATARPGIARASAPPASGDEARKSG